MQLPAWNELWPIIGFWGVRRDHQAVVAICFPTVHMYVPVNLDIPRYITTLKLDQQPHPMNA